MDSSQVNYKEVAFGEYCNRCKHYGEDENDEDTACFDCLFTPAREYSHKPTHWEAKDA